MQMTISNSDYCIISYGVSVLTSNLLPQRNTHPSYLNGLHQQILDGQNKEAGFKQATPGSVKCGQQQHNLPKSSILSAINGTCCIILSFRSQQEKGNVWNCIDNLSAKGLILCNLSQFVLFQLESIELRIKQRTCPWIDACYN